jgi:hydroxyacylglutathione hydrolase
MNLEDHAGDIVRKARQTAKIPPNIAAKAAGLSETEFGSFEETGLSAWPLNYAVLGPLLGLNSIKLSQIAGGWLPEPVIVERWRELRCITTTQGGNRVNCYLIWDADTLDAALFDTGGDAYPVLQMMTENGIELKHLFVTHHHGDHVAALGAIQKAWPKVQIHSNDSLSAPATRNRPGEKIRLGSLVVGNQPTPGHSEDGVTYFISGFPRNQPLVAVVGDALFAGSMGRGFQSSDLLKRNVEQHILSLSPETLLCPGHGPLTTVQEELAHNPFFA